MKKLMFIVLALVLVAGITDAQSPITARLFKTYTTYTHTSDDTTGYVTIPVEAVMHASEVGVIAVATDSVHATVYIIGDNSQIKYSTVPLYKVVYTDSLIAWANTAYDGTTVALTYTKYFPIRDNTHENLPGCDRFKVGTVFFNALDQGNTAGRTLKYYLVWRK